MPISFPKSTLTTNECFLAFSFTFASMIVPTLIITFLNIYFGIDAGLIIDNSFIASDALMSGIK